MKVAIVHDWLDKYSGAEKVLECLVELYPESHLFSVVDHLEENQRGFIKNKPVQTTFIQQLPFSKNHFRKYLPLMPIAIEQLDLTSYDLILSSSHAVAKSVLTHPNQIHICYIHTPMRYLWDMQLEYFKFHNVSGISGFLIKRALHKMRVWDQISANRPDFYIANSNFVQQRVEKYYSKTSTVIFPPVNEDFSTFLEAKKENYYITISRLVPYKNIDLLIRSFKRSNRLLKILGSGPEYSRLNQLIGDSKNIELVGYQDDKSLRSLLGSAKAFVYAAKEDFGISMAEAQIAGVPVIAYGFGGAIDIVLPNQTGYLFEELSENSVEEALEKFERIGIDFSYSEISVYAIEKFSKKRFLKEIAEFIDKKIELST